MFVKLRYTLSSSVTIWDPNILQIKYVIAVNSKREFVTAKFERIMSKWCEKHQKYENIRACDKFGEENIQNAERLEIKFIQLVGKVWKRT